MLPVILIFILTAILTVLVVISYYLPSDHAIQSNEKLGGQFGQTKNYVFTSMILISPQITNDHHFCTILKSIIGHQ